MVGVVQADGDELADVGHWTAVARLAFNQRQFVSFDLADFGQSGGAELLSANVFDNAA